MHVFSFRIAFIITIIIFVESIYSNSQFCSTLYTTTKQDQCPNPLSFDILEEYAKSLSSWKLNIPILKNESDIDIIEELKKRFDEGNSCPYVRQMNKAICCSGWEGPGCNKPENSVSQNLFSTCHVWGRARIRTFDGTYYRFPGSCSYKLIGSSTWQLNIQFINCTTTKTSCQKKLTIVIAGKILEVTGTNLTNVTAYPSNLIIQRQETNFLDLYFTNGIRLKVHDQHQQTIIIQLDDNFINDQSLSGLCGDYNQKPDDDFKILTTGLITNTPADFGNQWKSSQSCPDTSIVIDNCSITSEAIDACIALTNQSEIFQPCFNKIDYRYFYQACLNDVCSAKSENASINIARCQALEAYAEECREHDIYIQWRSNTGCAKQCSSPNMAFKECASSCRRTCQNPSSTITQCHTQTSECTPRCVCTNGTVYDSFRDECVQLEECTCQYNSIQYQPGYQVSIDCNDCTCDRGRWICTNRTCSRTCTVLGNMNILTFDGKQYALVSKCNQVLVETNDQSGYLRITYTNEQNELNIQILNTKVVFRQNNVLINGKVRHVLPYETNDVIIRRASTVFLEVRNIQSTVVLHYDPLAARIYVKLHPSFVNRVRGLCGTFNYITNDDFLTPNNVIETDLVTFANAYLTSSCSISEQQTDNCFNLPANESNAQSECTNLLKHPMFSDCSPLHVDPSFFLKACIRDLCEDQSTAHRDEVKCSVITALAHVCALKGIIIDWMSNQTLANTCQTINYGQCGSASRAHYSECVSECQSFCTDIDLLPSSCINQCLPGCACGSGQFYDEHSDVCQSQQDCSCFESQSEQYIHPAHSLRMQSPIVSNCSCSNGSLQCTPFGGNQCSSTQLYSVNATLCPLTCTNYQSHFDCGLYAPGCVCPPGKIFLDATSNQQQCVSIDECPCQYNRQFYNENQTIMQNDHGCQSCTCRKGGVWSCKKIPCTKTCTIFGHAHYRTFDGLYYNFLGACQYILVEDLNSAFRILSQNVPCGPNGQICSKNIVIEYNGVVIDLMRERPIVLNDIELSNYQIQPVTLGGIYIYQLGIYTMIKTDAFAVKWDGQTYVEIAIRSNSEMLGLCGNNNDNFDDDLKSADGASQFNVFDMAKSWQTCSQCAPGKNQSIDNDPCGENYSQRRTWAKNKCDIIKIKSSIFNNPFEICIDKMETHLIEKYYQACLYDACHVDHGGDCESVCTVLSAYAAECQSIIKTPTIKWRTSDRCPVQCDSDKVYMPCGPLCPQTCFEDGDYGGCSVDSGCVGGCFCPNGQVMDNNGHCIEPHRCPCLYNNIMYPRSTRIIMKKNETCRHECECQHGSFLCDKIETTICETTNCTTNQFTCESDGQCIPLSWLCDKVEDCSDGTDELSTHCQYECFDKTNSFQCSNGQCTNATYRCDGLPDCRDGSDEVNCSYVIPCKEYECPRSKLCIPKAWVCDGTSDCGYEDDSDESSNCKINQCDILSGRYFQCREDFNCLPVEQKCDGHRDCNFGSDELNCTLCTCTSSFSCTHICQCIDARRVCDGSIDCIDGTDELNCMANCAKDEYTCLDGKCLNINFLCDGIQHCLKGEDETHPDCTSSTTKTTVSHGSTTSTMSPIAGILPTLTIDVFTTPTTPIWSASLACALQATIMDDRFLSTPEFSTPIIGSISDMNPGGNGIGFVVNNPATTVIITLPLQQHIIIKQLVKFEILRPSNVNRFQLTFLNKNRQPVGRYKILSTDGKLKLTSPTVDTFPIEASLLKHIRFFKIEILDTNDNRPPKNVTLLFQACFKQTGKPTQRDFRVIIMHRISNRLETRCFPYEENCTQIDAMKSLYTTRIISKFGGTRPFNSTYNHLLQGYGGVTYNTSQAVIDIRMRKNILSRFNEISIPDYMLNRTNVRKIIVELFDKNHNRLFWEKTTNMKVLIHSTKTLRVRFIRISILETTDNNSPFNVTLSVQGCFYRKHPTKPTTKKQTKTTTATTKSTCYRVNAVDPQYAHRIIGLFEGTQPLPSYSFIDFIKSTKRGVHYAIKSPIIRIRFQTNVIGQLDEISISHGANNIRQFQVDLFDFDNSLLFSRQTTYLRNNRLNTLSIIINRELLVSTVQITVLNTIDDRPARGIILSIIGCFSTVPRLSTASTTTTTLAPTTTRLTTKRPRDCVRKELMTNKNIIIGITSQSEISYGNLASIGRTTSGGITFSDLFPFIDIILRPNLLIYIHSISIISKETNLERFRIELLNNENDIQYKIESSSMTVNLDSLPSVVLAGIRITFLETDDNQPPQNITLSIQACVDEILIITPATTTPLPTTRRTYPTTTPITPDNCVDIDAMQESYSERTLAGLSGTNPQGSNTSLLDLIYGKSISFDEQDDETVVFIIFKPNLFVYLKHVALTSISDSNVKRISIEYLDRNQVLIRKITVDYSNGPKSMEPIQNVGAVKITIEETYDGKSAKNVRLAVRGCFALPPKSTATVHSTMSTTTPTPCHHLNLMSNKPVSTKVIAYIAGTNPCSSSILNYFNPSKSISYSKSHPKVLIIFKTNIYVELKSISIINNATNVREYKIDLIDNDRLILQTITVDNQRPQLNVTFYVPIAALQITYLTTVDGKTPRNITLSIDGCFGINLSPTTATQRTTVTTARHSSTSKTYHCHEIEMMNKLDSTILVDSITGTLPRKTTHTLTDYFNQTSSVSYDEQQLPITFLMIFKPTIFAEIHSVSLTSVITNVKRFQVDLIDDYKSIVQTIESNKDLIVDGLTEIGIAALRISYIETKDNQAPINIRLSIKGCFGVLPTRRRATPSIAAVSPPTTPMIESATTSLPRTTQRIKQKCVMLDAMAAKNRHKIILTVNSTEHSNMFSSNGLSFNSTSGSIFIAFKQGIFGHIDHISIIGHQHNIKHYEVSFFDLDNDKIDERLLKVDCHEKFSADNVAAIRIVFLDTNDNRNINHVQLSIRGCFFRIPKFETTQMTTMTTTKRHEYCHSIDLMNKQHVKSLIASAGGTLAIPKLFNATQKDNHSIYFILEFKKDIFIRHIQNISILTTNHRIQQIRIELLDENRQLLKRIDLSVFKQILSTNLYFPTHPTHIQYLKVTITKGKPIRNICWSIIGCFDRITKVQPTEKISKQQWWTVKCLHSNIMAGRNGYHPRKFLTPYITGTPSPIDENFKNVMTDSMGISYSERQKPIILEVDFPSGIAGRLFEVGIRSSNVYRILVQLIELPNSILYTLTSPHYNKTDKKNSNPRLTGFPPVSSSGIRVILLDTIDGLPPRRVNIFTNGCFYKSSVRYTSISTARQIKKTMQQSKTTTTLKPRCRYSEWTRWGHCSVSCGNGVQTRARNQLSGSGCNAALMDYRMCQLQPCMCVLTKEFYMSATSQKVPVNDIVGYLKDGGKAVHIGDILDTGTIVYAYNCSQFICSNVGLDVKKSTGCQQKCVYLSWSPWSSCEGQCGDENRAGIQFRQRTSVQILTGSHLCKPDKETRSCQTPPCFGSCILSSWSNWSSCSKSCNLGGRKRSRYYLSFQPNCTDQLEEIQDCNPQCCPSSETPTWSGWSPWSKCSQLCNGGERIRSRTCKNDASHCKQGIICEGSDKQIEPCNTGQCPETLACTNGRIMSNCSNTCGYTCNTLTCRSCNEPSICVSGCVCPSPLVMSTSGECIEINQCLCQISDGKISLVHGQTMSDRNTCQDCLCSNGCLNCRPSTKDCSTCEWSTWSSFGVCSAQCNGTQARYRSRSCVGLEPEIEQENRTCSTNETSYRKGCTQCSCDVTTGQETCNFRCAVTPDICSKLTNDPFATYEYVAPIDGECCGSCNRTKKIEPCSVQELPVEQLVYNDCVSINPVPRQQCLGTCISGMTCRCCSPSEINMEPIEMQCQRLENNITIAFIEEIPYARIRSCSCNECVKDFKL
ncbi:unnamed protein product [Rotaria socialis]